MSFLYRLVLGLAAPVVRRWGRLEATGSDLIPTRGATLIIGNHDSFWDPVVVGVAALDRRQIRAVSKSTLWVRPLGWILDGMKQLKITRGRACRTELAEIVGALRAGDCVGIFPEGRISKGQKIRAYSGAGWLAKAVPETRVVAVAITGAVELARFPKRPRIKVHFFEPVGGQRRAGETSIGFSRRVLTEVRDRAPATRSGRAR
jgi:1-acyl-sn-glycerol-3-phosphate acyltransferase